MPNGLHSMKSNERSLSFHNCLVSDLEEHNTSANHQSAKYKEDVERLKKDPSLMSLISQNSIRFVRRLVEN